MTGDERLRSPAMIATVTLNPALDKTMSVPGFAVGRTNRGEVRRLDPGGKGINVAQAVKQLGCPVVASGFLAGNNGRYIEEVLASKGILTDFVRVAGETRVNLKIIDPVAGTETEVNEPGFRVEEADLRLLARKLEDLARRCTVIVLAGSLPPGVPIDAYCSFIRIAKACGAKTILDAEGPALRNGMGAGPDLIKPNRTEVEELLQTTVAAEGDLVRAARQLLALGPGSVAISLGAEGALIASASRLLRARPPTVKTGSTVGAGDSMVGAFAYALMKDLELDHALRLATAVSSATATLEGSEVADADLIRDLLPRVALEELS